MFRRKAPEAPTPEQESPEPSSGDYLAQMHHPANEPARRYYGHKILAIALLLSLGLNGATLAVASYLAPRTKIVPLLLQIKPHTEVIAEVQPLNADIHTFRLIVDDTLRRYVRHRHSVVPSRAEMTRRWRSESSLIVRYSTTAVYDIFRAQTEALLKDLRRTPFEREVEIIQSIPDSNLSLWTIEYRTGTRLVGTTTASETSWTRWVARVSIVRLPPPEGEAAYAALLRNPLHIYIREYTSERVDNEQSQT